MEIKRELNNKLNNDSIKFTRDQILRKLIKLYQLNTKLFKFLRNENVTGYELDVNIGVSSESSGITLGQGTNPLLWELGHICFFYEYHCFNNLENNYQYYIEDKELYDSFLTSREYRFNYRPYSKCYLFSYFEYIFQKSIALLFFDRKLDKISNYLFMLVILHNHMHCESFIFTQKLLGFKNEIYTPLTLDNFEINFSYIKIKGGSFIQGNVEGENNFSFDNEMPKFETFVNDFSVSKYCVTELMVLNFILDKGYQNKKYWCTNGWRWINSNKINKPFYWIKDEDNYKINDNGIIRNISHNLPASHISWFEANAICSWLGGRLPTESEWEYLATNHGNSIYPWGNKFYKDIGNLNYSGNICCVNNFEKGDNIDGVRQLFGNVWEWCQEAIYPYDGFKIDSVYKEFSYPFFGFKKILRGGSWATPDILINSRYRNAQMPDCRIQFTGFRVVKVY